MNGQLDDWQCNFKSLSSLYKTKIQNSAFSPKTTQKLSVASQVNSFLFHLKRLTSAVLVYFICIYQHFPLQFPSGSATCFIIALDQSADSNNGSECRFPEQTEANEACLLWMRCRQQTHVNEKNKAVGMFSDKSHCPKALNWLNP